MAEITIDRLRNFEIRELKSWRTFDQILAAPCKGKRRVNYSIKLEAAKFILERLYPEKVTDTRPMSQIVIVEKQDLSTPPPVQERSSQSISVLTRDPE